MTELYRGIPAAGEEVAGEEKGSGFQDTFEGNGLPPKPPFDNPYSEREQPFEPTVEPPIPAGEGPQDGFS